MTEAKGRRVAEMMKLLREHEAEIECMEIGRVEFNFGPSKVALFFGRSIQAVRLESAAGT